MKVDNSLSREFLLNYPTQAARTLEQLSAEHVVALLVELPQYATPVVAAMLPDKAAACISAMPAEAAATLMSELPVTASVRIYRLLLQPKRNQISSLLSDETQSQIQQYLQYPPSSVGALLDPQIEILPQNITVGEAIQHIERLPHAVSCDIYIVNDEHHLQGMIKSSSLLTANHSARLKEIMQRKTQMISVHATTDTLLSHPGWKKHLSLPVVERDNTLLGVLDYYRLKDSLAEEESFSATDPLDNLLNMSSLYWLSLTQLVDSVVSITSGNTGENIKPVNDNNTVPNDINNKGAGK